MNFYTFKKISNLPEDIIMEIGHKYFVAKNTINFGLREIIEFSNYITELVPLASDITSFPRMNYLKVLSISSQHLYELPALPNLAILDLYQNINLTKLPTFPKLQVLQFSDNNKIEELPMMPNLRALTLDNNNIIKNLPRLPLLRLLKLGNNNKIDILPDMPNLQVLILSLNNKIKILPALPKLKWLDLGANNQIKTLPSLPNLKLLHFNLNDKITKLPRNLHQLRYLDLGNNVMQSLSTRLTRLEYLNLSSARISKLPPLPSLKILYFGINKHLKRLFYNSSVIVKMLPPGHMLPRTFQDEYIDDDLMYQHQYWPICLHPPGEC